MTDQRIIDLIGIPMDAGAGQRGATMGPACYRAAGLGETLAALGHDVHDHGDISPDVTKSVVAAAEAGTAGAHNAALVAGWMRAIDAAVAAAIGTPVFLGGDHSLSAASINAMAGRAEADGRPLHVLWLDAHSDINTPETSPSGNIHGMPVAALTGAPELDFLYDGIARHPLAPAAFHMFGIRSVDAQERSHLRRRGIHVIDMRQIDEHGTARLMEAVLGKVAAAGAHLHVSLDVDFLDPSIAPGVGTTVPGGATYREAHLVMEMLADGGAVTSLDLVELNPFLDHGGMSARLMVELVASLFGRSILERPGTAAHSLVSKTEGARP